jgi:hypothetical protein
MTDSLGLTSLNVYIQLYEPTHDVGGPRCRSDMKRLQLFVKLFETVSPSNSAPDPGLTIAGFFAMKTAAAANSFGFRDL